MITIKEIAAQLNMSTTTVSNVIHGKTGEVSPQTIERVQEFLKKVDYVPNINARNLAQNKSGIIGFAMKARADKYSNLLTDPFVSEMVGGIEAAVRKAGYFMMIYISSDIGEIMRRVSTWNVDGLLLFGMLDDDGIRVSEKYKKPIVCIDTYSIEGLKHFTNVGLEDEKGAYDMAKYLIDNGQFLITKKALTLPDSWAIKKLLQRPGLNLRKKTSYRYVLIQAKSRRALMRYVKKLKTIQPSCVFLIYMLSCSWQPYTIDTLTCREMYQL